MRDEDLLDPLRVARRIADELERVGISYAIGGALAYGFWGPPRGTIDVDVDVFIEDSRLGTLFEALSRAEVTLDANLARRHLAERGDFRGDHRGMRVDVFVGFDEYHLAVESHRVRVEVLGRPAWILSAEDIIVFKILFDRPKDWVDLERLIALRSGVLDHGYVTRWLTHWLGVTDARLGRLEELILRFRPDEG